MNLIPSFYEYKNKIWSGARNVPYYNSDCSIGKIFFRKLENYPNNTLQISDTESTTMTNHEVLTAAKRIAQHLQKMDLGQDDVIGIAALNTTYVMPLVVACLFNCTPFHAVNPLYDEKTLTQTLTLGVTKPKLIFCDGEFYEKIQRASQSFKPLIYTLFDHIEGVPKVLDLLEPTKEELIYKPQSLTHGKKQTMAILCSTGTTGLPKAVCIPNSRLILKEFATSQDVIYSASGIYCASGLYFLIMNCLSGCKRIISNKPFSAEYFVEIAQKHKITTVSFSPLHASAFVKSATAPSANLASLRCIFIGGGYIASSKIQALRKIFENALVIYTYGTTETGILSQNFEVEKIASVGKLLPGIRVRIVDESGQNLGPMEVGELYVDHGHTWIGYYNNPKASQTSCDSEGWFHTGDLGYFDADNFLYIVDRKRDILTFKNLQFWTCEIEDCILEISQVKKVCVVSIHDEDCGDKAGALIVKSKGSKLSEKDIQDYVAKNLVLEHKQLHAGVVFVESLPHNFKGKIQKNQAKQIFLTHKQYK